MSTSRVVDTEAVMVGGRLVNPDDHTDQFLSPDEVARRLEVSRGRPSKWARLHHAEHRSPYPANVLGQYVRVGRSLWVLQSALDAWAADVFQGRPASIGGPRRGSGERG